MIEIKLPRIGLSMESGRIIRWLKKEGDYLKKGEPFVEIEADKSTVTIESIYSGYIRKILAEEGNEVAIETVIAVLEDIETS